MTPALDNILALLLVAAAAIYMLVCLRRAAAGQSACDCGSKACASPPSSSEGLPLLPAQCTQGCPGCDKG